MINSFFFIDNCYFYEASSIFFIGMGPVSYLDYSLNYFNFDCNYFYYSNFFVYKCIFFDYLYYLNFFKFLIYT